MGQAMGGAMRGLRPIAEIQYLDYMAYAFSLLTDDLATLRYRTNGIQRSPAIVRTRGHRLEGIWHAGSPMGMILTSMQGIYLCVPRNMVQAVGFYNTLLKSDDPGIVVECLNGYRLKEKLPTNLLDFTVALGKPEILQEGTDITLVTYGSCVREAQKGLELLNGFDVSVELIDAQTLMPFDLEGVIVNSLKKTNRIIFMDEDIPGGATAYMMREVLEKWDGYKYLDAKPITLSAAAHRTPFGSDGDYFTKPNPDDVFETIMDMAKEAFPNRF
jgi:pyruvate/2-oxoglutarate/acetoin dehydrogenase E1 component